MACIHWLLPSLQIKQPCYTMVDKTNYYLLKIFVDLWSTWLLWELAIKILISGTTLTSVLSLSVGITERKSENMVCSLCIHSQSAYSRSSFKFQWCFANGSVQDLVNSLTINWFPTNLWSLASQDIYNQYIRSGATVTNERMSYVIYLGYIC